MLIQFSGLCGENNCRRIAVTHTMRRAAAGRHLRVCLLITLCWLPIHFEIFSLLSSPPLAHLDSNPIRPAVSFGLDNSSIVCQRGSFFQPLFLLSCPSSAGPVLCVLAHNLSHWEERHGKELCDWTLYILKMKKDSLSLSRVDGIKQLESFKSSHPKIENKFLLLFHSFQQRSTRTQSGNSIYLSIYFCRLLLLLLCALYLIMTVLGTLCVDDDDAPHTHTHTYTHTHTLLLICRPSFTEWRCAPHFYSVPPSSSSPSNLYRPTLLKNTHALDRYKRLTVDFLLSSSSSR